MNFQELTIFIAYISKVVTFQLFTNKNSSPLLPMPHRFFSAKARAIYITDTTSNSPLTQNDLRFLEDKGIETKTIYLLQETNDSSSNTQHSRQDTSTKSDSKFRLALDRLRELQEFNADILILRSKSIHSSIRQATCIITPSIRIAFGTGIPFPYSNVILPDVDSTLFDHF